jgi:hypothetical protein
LGWEDSAQANELTSYFSGQGGDSLVRLTPYVLNFTLKLYAIVLQLAILSRLV